jgi:CHRD domain/PEP-CTERM motif
MTLNRSLAALALAAALPAAAQQMSWEASLTGAAEAPPNASNGLGYALVTVDLGLQTIEIDASFSGLTGVTTVAHIHCCTAQPGAGAIGVAVTPGTLPGFPAGVSSGTYNATIDLNAPASYTAAFLASSGGTADAAFDTLIAGFDGGTAYFNVHSSAFPGGEIRGFLAPVPEPQTYALMLAGLAVVAWAARRQRRGA